MMIAIFQSPTLQTLATIFIGSVWMVFGLYCKILNRVPRHRRIVERVLGPGWGRLTPFIGVGEVLLGLWVFSGWHQIACAAVLTAGIVVMNALEIWRAREALLSPSGMVALNAMFIALIWCWALATPMI